MAFIHDAVVIGAGPAGLSAAAEISASCGRCLLLEQGAGHRVRDRDAPEDILSGVGGAGLFSDGKHSFFPAASELWRLPHQERLAYAYQRTRELLSRHGVMAPPFPAAIATSASDLGDGWRLKDYPSVYASLEERLSCIQELVAQCGEEPWLAAQVLDVTRTGTGFTLQLEQHGARTTIETARLVIATGRLSPRWIRPWLEPLGVGWRFRRLEFGVRLETHATAEIFAALRGVDPKLTWVDASRGLELRTFCTCRDGEVVLGRACELHAFSGRADGPKTGRSSVGLLVRTTDEALAREIAPHLFAKGRAPLRTPLGEILNQGESARGLVEIFGSRGAALVSQALRRFLARFPALEGDPSASLYAPCVEGVGDYPLDDGDLKLAPGIWIAGDACGRFRGIVASLVSGRYVGAEISAELRGRR